MTKRKRPLSSYARGGAAAWPESERFPRRIFEEQFGDLAPAVIDQIVPAWQDYKANQAMRSNFGTPAEQVAAARDLGTQCMALARLLSSVDLQHLEAAAWADCNRRGIDLDAEKKYAVDRLRIVGAAYLAAATKAPTPVSARPSRQSRDELARSVLDVVDPHCTTRAAAAVCVDAVLRAAGADCPNDIETYCRRIRR